MSKSISAAYAISIAMSAQALAGTTPSPTLYPSFSSESGARSVPTVSGKYLLSFTETCQAEISTTQNSKTGDVQSLNSVDPGEIMHGTALATISGGKLKTTGFQDKGSLLIVKGMSGQASMAESSWNQNVPFSNTASTVTIGGQQFHAWFEPASGAAQTIVFGGLSDKGCAATGTAIRQ